MRGHEQNVVLGTDSRTSLARTSGPRTRSKAAPHLPAATVPSAFFIRVRSLRRNLDPRQNPQRVALRVKVARKASCRDTTSLQSLPQRRLVQLTPQPDLNPSLKAQDSSSPSCAESRISICASVSGASIATQSHAAGLARPPSRQQPAALHLRDAAPGMRATNALHIRVAMRRGQKAREALLNVNALVRAGDNKANSPAVRSAGNRNRRLIGNSRSARAPSLPQTTVQFLYQPPAVLALRSSCSCGPACFKMIQHGQRRRHRQRMPHKRSRKKCDARFRETNRRRTATSRHPERP